MRPSLLTRRKKKINEGIEAAARWGKDVRNQYIHKSLREIHEDESLADDFKIDLKKMKKAKNFMRGL